MAYMKHNAIVVTYWNKDDINTSHAKAKEIFKRAYDSDPAIGDGSTLVSDIVRGIVNEQQYSFLLLRMAA